jgi:hypothetical protein
MRGFGVSALRGLDVMTLHPRFARDGTGSWA